MAVHDESSFPLDGTLEVGTGFFLIDPVADWSASKGDTKSNIDLGGEGGSGCAAACWV